VGEIIQEEMWMELSCSVVAEQRDRLQVVL
jgi:hypothetical protein